MKPPYAKVAPGDEYLSAAEALQLSSEARIFSTRPFASDNVSPPSLGASRCPKWYRCIGPAKSGLGWNAGLPPYSGVDLMLHRSPASQREWTGPCDAIVRPRKKRAPEGAQRTFNNKEEMYDAGNQPA